MKLLRPVLIVAMLAVVNFLGGCSQKLFAHIFNRTDHEISLLQQHTGGKLIVVPPGGDVVVPLWGVTRGKQRGFLIKDGAEELFYAVLTEDQDKSNGYASWTRLQPKESARGYRGGREYLLEYTRSSEVFALRAAGDSVGSRVLPQPTGFPIKPNQSPEPTHAVVTPPAEQEPRQP